MTPASRRLDGAVVRRGLVGILAVLATVMIVAALDTPDAPTATAAAATPGTPLWSVRRTPQLVADAAEAQRVQAALAARVEDDRACFTVRETGTTIAETGAADALVPASTAKLMTAAAALADLGPGFRFTTSVLAPAPPTGGRVERLYLLGGGDPLLASPERITFLGRDPERAGLATTALATLADRIVAAGVRRVPGGVVGVDDRYETTRYVGSWTPGARASIGPVGALTVNGGRGGPAGTGPAVTDPAVNAAGELGRLLTARGVTVGAVGRAAHAPDGATAIARLPSPRLPAILTEMLSASDNLTAEMLTRELAYRADRATPGTTPRGVEATVAALTRLHLDVTGLHLVDGSGLSHDDTVRCPTLLGVLELTDRARFRPIADGLAIAATRGTLATEFRGTSLAGKLRAKTGTLDGVSGLAGFVDVTRPLTFALLVNGSFGEAGAAAVREAMAADIASYGTGFPLDTVPEPNAPIPPRACPPSETPC